MARSDCTGWSGCVGIGGTVEQIETDQIATRFPENPQNIVIDKNLLSINCFSSRFLTPYSVETLNKNPLKCFYGPKRGLM